MGNPFFSICIPTYKQPQLLNKLLSSINKQNFRDFEVIISDDSEDDSVLQIINTDWTFKIKYFQNEKPLGAPENWNNAIEKCDGKWIKLMHHDDYFANDEALSIIHNSIINNNEVAFFFCATLIYETKSKNIIEYKPNEKYIKLLSLEPANLFFANVIGGPSATIFRSDITIRFDKSIVWLSDIEFYTHIILKYKIKSISNKLIVTSAELETQLSRSLIDNKSIELYEFFYCYKKLKVLLDSQNNKVFREVLLDMIDKYNVKSIKEINEINISFNRNTLLFFYIITKSKILKALIRKLNRKL